MIRTPEMNTMLSVLIVNDLTCRAWPITSFSTLEAGQTRGIRTGSPARFQADRVRVLLEWISGATLRREAVTPRSISAQNASIRLLTCAVQKHTEPGSKAASVSPACQVSAGRGCFLNPFHDLRHVHLVVMQPRVPVGFRRIAVPAVLGARSVANFALLRDALSWRTRLLQKIFH